MTITEETNNIYHAMLKAQGEFDKVVKTEKVNGEKFSYTYANLEQLIEKTRPALEKNGLVIMQFPINEEGRVGVKTILAHESGETLESQYASDKHRPDPQGIGSLITYFRRYAYMAVCGIAPEDDDAQGAMPSERHDPTDDWSTPEKPQNLGNCPKCGAPMAWSAKSNKAYCSKLCWKQ